MTKTWAHPRARAALELVEQARGRARAPGVRRTQVIAIPAAGPHVHPLTPAREATLVVEEADRQLAGGDGFPGSLRR